MIFQTNNCSSSQPEARGFARLCSLRVLWFLTFLFAAALGIILGAYFSATLLASITAVIVGTVILAIIIIAMLIYRACSNNRFGC